MTPGQQVRHSRLVAERDAAREALDEFRDGLTKALNKHGVPAMPSWQEAIDYLARHGGRTASVNGPPSCSTCGDARKVVRPENVEPCPDCNERETLDG